MGLFSFCLTPLNLALKGEKQKVINATYVELIMKVFLKLQ